MARPEWVTYSDEEIEELASKIRKMKEEGTHLCCSIGFLTKKQALMLKEAGLDRINHNLNTSRSNYPNICTTHTYEQRVNNIHMLQDPVSYTHLTLPTKLEV